VGLGSLAVSRAQIVALVWVIGGGLLYAVQIVRRILELA
jgi:hypothetical protein